MKLTVNAEAGIEKGPIEGKGRESGKFEFEI